MATKIQGIDISYHNGTVDWSKVKNAGIKFAILREGYRNTIDQQFLANVKGCVANNIPVMVYHFIYTNSATVKENAISTVSNMKKAGLDPSTTYIWADLEYDTWKKNGETCTKAACSNYTEEYIKELKTLGCKKIGIYMNNDYYKNYYTTELINNYPIWLADYNGNPDYSCKIQQYSSSGKIDGINSTSVDMNYLFDESMLQITTTNTGGNNMSISSIIENAISWMESAANDNSHGYDQIYRWGQKGDYDCSAAVITAWQNAGVPVKTKGASYTGNMLNVFKSCGFVDITSSINLSTGSGLQRGDVLLNTGHHTAMYCGNGQEVEASINEKGTATGGTPGDQTGKEFLIRSYRNYPWTNILRYTGGATVAATSSSSSSSSGNTSYCGKGIGTATALDCMNIRSGSSTSNSSYGTISKGTKVEVLEVLSNGWYKIVWPGASCGYAFTSNTTGTYYSLVKNATTTATSSSSSSSTASSKVTAKESATGFNKSLAGTYKTTANLNVRTGAGTNKAILVTIPNGTSVKNYGYYTPVSGTNWLYIQFTYKNVLYTGFASGAYLKK